MNTLRSKKIDPKKFIEKIRRLREKTIRIKLTERSIYKAKNEGRP